ncbi:MAG: YaiI/YqxD family protein [Pseudomonadota bacterium]
MSDTITIYVDADACPVKQEVMRVAERHSVRVAFVSNAYMRLPEGPLVQRVIVEEGPDVADDWIAERAGAADIVITQDIPLASRALKAGAAAIGPTGKPFDKGSIGMALAMRELKQHMRETGEGGNFNAAFTARDRSQFLQALENAVQNKKRELSARR